MPKFKIPVSWSVCGTMYIEADTLDDALDIAGYSDTPLPDKYDYLEDSLLVDEDFARDLNEPNLEE